MEYYKEKEQALLGTERFVLVMYSIYCINISISGLRNDWERWAITLMLAMLFFCWVAHRIRYKTYALRSTIETMGIGLCMFFCGVHADSLESELPTIFVLVGLVGIMGIPELVMVEGVFLCFLVWRQGVILWNLGIEWAEFMNHMVYLMDVFFYLVIIFIWVQRRQKSARTTQAALEKKDKAEKGRDDFVANVSHEIRTPLNIICGTTQSMELQEEETVFRQEISAISMASRRLMAIVSDILDFSELVSGEPMLEEEVYDLTSTINDVINMTMAQMENRTLELIVDMDSSIPKLLMGDEKKIRRILMHLIDNAIKFTRTGGVILKITARRESYGVNLRFTVQDTGIGMKQEEIEKLFTKYNQADTERNRRGEGIGLGIVISQLLARTLGGVITVRSKLHQGSQFTLVVPQKVVMDTPIVQLENPHEVHAAVYFDLESYDTSEIRDAYGEMIEHMSSQLDVLVEICHNRDELKRVLRTQNITHIFIPYKEFMMEQEFYENAGRERSVCVLLEKDGKADLSPGIKSISYPFYMLSAATVLNSEKPKEDVIERKHEIKFRAPGAKILVVDDNQMNIRVIAGLLKQYEIKVEPALSGAEALEKILSMDYDFVFMDHMMPEMDGVECTGRIRGKLGTYFQKVPIVAWTANAIAGSRERFLKEGFNDFLEKPIEPSVLERVLRRNLPTEKILPINYSDEKQEERKKEPMEHTDSIWNKLDKEIGCNYCGGEETYYVILGESVNSYKEMASDLEKVYAQEDFSLYTIQIHGLKSAMKSIGAMELSEMAKELEFASRAGEYDKVRAGHGAVMDTYYDLMLQISKMEEVADYIEEGLILEKITYKGEKESMPVKGDVNLPSISREEMDELKKQFEQAMYGLDEESMRKVVSKLEGRAYENKDLSELVTKMKHKLERGDYFSAGDLLTSLEA